MRLFFEQIKIRNNYKSHRLDLYISLSHSQPGHVSNFLIPVRKSGECSPISRNSGCIAPIKQSRYRSRHPDPHYCRSLPLFSPGDVFLITVLSSVGWDSWENFLCVKTQFQLAFLRMDRRRTRLGNSQTK